MIICEMSNCQWGIVTYLIYIYFLTLFLLTNLKAAFWIYNSKCLIMLIFYPFNCTLLYRELTN